MLLCLSPGTPLDQVAGWRATTTYLVQKAVPMLPELLCQDLCSLVPGVDRLTFSVMWTLDGETPPLVVRLPPWW